ncbi:MAG: hypothetical protein IPP80_07965 [Ignavibacteria bacterium]|nr:hypothetical protein [Ignavibacteria bacterium]
MTIMNQLKALFLCMLISMPCIGQTVYEPQILILAPNVVKYEATFAQEIATANEEIRSRSNNSELEQAIKSKDFKRQPKNLQIMTESEFEFAKNMDIFKQVSLSTQRYLTYRFYDKFPNLLLKLDNRKSTGTLDDLKTKSQKAKLQYIFNCASIELYVEDRIGYARIKVQLYDRVSNSLLVDKDYVGNWNNPGSEFACENRSVNCALNNALSQALEEVVHVIASNNPTLIREKQLQLDRYNVLVEKHLSKPFDKKLVESVISPKDSNVKIDNVYQVLYSPDRKKFVAFFLERTPAYDIGTLKDSTKDESITILSNRDVMDVDALGEIPRTYGYIVKGVNYRDKWYYEKSNATYFDASSVHDGQMKYFNHLQQWGFFKENSTESSAEFWETNQFAKIKDLTKDPDWSRYGEILWKTKEIEDRDYIGMYEIVANALKIAKLAENERFDSLTSRNIFIQAYEAQTKRHTNDFTKYAMINQDLTLIYPKERTVVMNPIMITNGKGEKALRFFLAFVDTKKIYEWTYFKPKTIPDRTWHYGSDIIEQLETITEWNFSLKTLDDNKFWSEYVLAKAGSTFKYLKELE